MHAITVYTSPQCPYCVQAKRLLAQKGVVYDEIDVSARPEARQAMLERSGGRRTVPQVFIGSRHVGGCDDLHASNRDGRLDGWLAEYQLGPGLTM